MVRAELVVAVWFCDSFDVMRGGDTDTASVPWWCTGALPGPLPYDMAL
jgi:hypothetical protein